jgi:hypothetical protein
MRTTKRHDDHGAATEVLRNSGVRPEAGRDHDVI